MVKIVITAVSVYILGFLSCVYLLARANHPDINTQTSAWQAAGSTVRAILNRDLMVTAQGTRAYSLENVKESPHHELATYDKVKPVEHANSLVDSADPDAVEHQSHNDIENIHRRHQPGSRERILAPIPAEDVAWLKEIEAGDAQSVSRNSRVNEKVEADQVDGTSGNK